MTKKVDRVIDVMGRIQALAKHGEMPLERVPGETAFQMDVEGENGTWVLIAQFREEEPQVLFYSACPVRAPAARRAAVAEYLVRASYGGIHATFEMDFDDGEIRCRTSAELSKTCPSNDLLLGLVHSNVEMMDQYLPGLKKVIAGEATPADAIAEAEADEDADES